MKENGNIKQISRIVKMKDDHEVYVESFSEASVEILIEIKEKESLCG